VVTFNPERSGRLALSHSAAATKGTSFQLLCWHANLLPCLLGVAAVGEEHRLLGAHQQGSSAAGKSAEIADVGQVGNQENSPREVSEENRPGHEDVARISSRRVTYWIRTEVSLRDFRIDGSRARQAAFGKLLSNRPEIRKEDTSPLMS